MGALFEGVLNTPTIEGTDIGPTVQAARRTLAAQWASRHPAVLTYASDPVEPIQTVDHNLADSFVEGLSSLDLTQVICNLIAPIEAQSSPISINLMFHLQAGAVSLSVDETELLGTPKSPKRSAEHSVLKLFAFLRDIAARTSASAAWVGTEGGLVEDLLSQPASSENCPRAVLSETQARWVAKNYWRR